MGRTLVAHQQPISKIFGEDYVFSIPGYQRPYAWTTEQAGELLDDLLTFLQAIPADSSDAEPYFLGSIVIIKQEAVPDATVVDGQQRLTTLTILLSAIRALATDADARKDLSSLIYEQGNVIRGTANRYRLTLREKDRDFFRQYIQHEGGILALREMNEPLSDAKYNIRANALYLLSRLDQVSEDERLRLAIFISTRCFLVAVETPNIDSAYRIFNVLNSRGLDLSATDILKAQIIGAVREQQRDAYTQKWEDIEEDLGRSVFSDLFSHIRMVYRKAKPQGTLLKEFAEHVKPTDSVAFIDDVLAPMARAFQEISDAAYSSTQYADQVNRHLHWLNRIEFKDWVPPALAFFVRHHGSPEIMLRFFRDLERLVYAAQIVRHGVNDRIELFSRLTAAVEKGEDLFAENSPLQLSPTFRWRVYEALNGPIYQTHAARARSVILLHLDALVSAGEASYDFETISVEHVLPQTVAPGSQWARWFPDLKAHAFWVHRLGNLALLSRKKNSSASNYDFRRKKEAYFTRNGVSSFALTTQVLQNEEWTEAVVKARHEALMRRLEEYWRLEGRVSPSDEILAALG